MRCIFFARRLRGICESDAETEVVESDWDELGFISDSSSSPSINSITTSGSVGAGFDSRLRLRPVSPLVRVIIVLVRQLSWFYGRKVMKNLVLILRALSLAE